MYIGSRELLRHFWMIVFIYLFYFLDDRFTRAAEGKEKIVVK